ncbi:phage tail tube protein [Xenorhabdus bovienii]|uniref:phage tail tube protein n=1 Tax=Xenorhabdus bovienii TaxID=40576 RepID=UPI0023B26D71|nr:phage tail tube protein [Xenorhabdus bovienii]MDE9447930.1 phage tail protein [Xenorhabdus bovienii]MDE9537005.1 phage tail protein [Xenorhabdus bovienii]MDE9589996.1 phage tail protein [Xenorhabdus bovienii]
MAKYEKTLATSLSVSAEAANDATSTLIKWVAIDTSVKEINYTGGQKSDIEVTTLGSREQEMINGLAAPAEITLSGHWTADEKGQDILRLAYSTDQAYAFRVQFPSGAGYVFLAEVRQESWQAAANGIVSASFTLRMKGRPTPLAKKPQTNTQEGQ